MKPAMLQAIVLLVSIAFFSASPILSAQSKSLKEQPFHTSDGPPALHVSRNRLQTRDGKTIRLQGVNIPSLEWSDTGDSQLMKSIDKAITVWHANAIRLPLSQDRWFGMAAKQTDDGAIYRSIVDGVVRAISAKKGYVILDLHWSNGGVWGKDIRQHNMPDLNSIFFWKDVAARYANVPGILFDLYNEPHDVTWEIWKSGGLVEEKEKDQIISYKTPGMQRLLGAVRGAGAKNIVVAGGLDWAYDLSGITKGFALDDPDVHGVMYATHIYPWKGSTHQNWDPHVTVAAAQYPILVGEAGCEPDAKQEDPVTWAPKILAYIDEHQLNWTAWCFHPGASPRMLADWDYNPTPYWGKFVFDELAKSR